MSVLSGPEVKDLIARTRAIKAAGGVQRLPAIDVYPLADDAVGPNSVDVRLGDTLLVYGVPADDASRLQQDGGGDFSWEGEQAFFRPTLDPTHDNRTTALQIPAGGLVLRPGHLYLGSTVETVECDGCVPWIDGRSSVGRLGLSVHVTAGRGDDGWRGRFTLELTCVHRVRVYPGMKIAQVTFLRLSGDRDPYRGRYQGAAGPEASKFHQG